MLNFDISSSKIFALGAGINGNIRELYCMLANLHGAAFAAELADFFAVYC